MRRIGPDTVVVITGASGGVGRATARLLAERGAKLVLLARDEDGLEAAKAEVESRGAKALMVPTDVSQFEQVEAAADLAEERFGPIDLWINSAMVFMDSPVMEITSWEFRQIVEATFLGAVNGTHCAMKRMIPRDRGMVIQVGSPLVFRSIPLQSAYRASKHAIRGFTESLQSELIHLKSNVGLSIVNMPALNPMKLDRMSHRFSLKHWANKNRVAIICALLAGLGLAALFMFGTQKTSGGVSRKIQNRMSLT